MRTLRQDPPLDHNNNYNAFVHPHSSPDGSFFHNVGVKHCTDILGGTKFYLDSNSPVGNRFGYPDYKQCATSSPTWYSSELSEIPTTGLWKPFWEDMARAHEKGSNHSGFQLLGGFAALLGTVLSVVFFSTTAFESTFWSRIIPPSFVVCLLVYSCCCGSDAKQEWRRVIAKHRPSFQVVGYEVELLTETTEMNGFRGISSHCCVCHIRKSKSTP